MPSLDFALIGHSETWQAAANVISALRGAEHPAIPSEDLRQILPWIPPRTVCRVTAGSVNGSTACGVYIDSFIPPDRLEGRYLQENLVRVRESAEYAVREGAKIATLGGFSSILLEGKLDLLPQHTGTAFTTGNTLTVAFIAREIERAMELAGRDLRDTKLLIIGASGDVGSGCARYLGPRVRRLLLSARLRGRLEELASELKFFGAEVEVDTDVQRLARGADLVICAASLAAPTLLLEALPAGAIVCDAGYPKNLQPRSEPPEGAVFFGGLGQVSGGLRLDPDLAGILNPHPFPNVAHGCLLEGIALALERRFEPFSRGRGLINARRVDEIWSIARKHGITVPPLFNAEGPVEARIRGLAQDVHV